MSCGDNVEAFRRGTTLRLPFLITADGAIVDITGGTVTAIVEPLGQDAIELTVGAGVEIDDENPAVAAEGEEQLPHGYITLEPEQTDLLPYGQLTKLTLLYLTPQDVLTYAPTIWLRGE